MYYVYIVKCKDNTLYTGYTTDVDKRITSHNTGTVGAKYTKARRPVVLVYKEEFTAKGEALKREWAIKKLTRQAKIDLYHKFIL